MKTISWIGILAWFIAGICVGSAWEARIARNDRITISIPLADQSDAPAIMDLLQRLARQVKEERETKANGRTQG